MPVKNIRDCDNPPGGQIVCEPHQIAICGVIDGVVRRECLDPPSDGSPAELVNWAMSLISGEQRHADSRITAGDLQVLNSRTYKSPIGDVVNFNLPNDMTAMLLLLVQKLQESDSSNGSAEM